MKSIIDLHDGCISIDSEVEKGSMFTIQLPKRVLEYSNEINQDRSEGRKIEMINIENSDIY